jgi:cardiolipin synthase
MLSLLKAINLAKKEILLTTPYFIPGETIINALKVASLGGVTVKVLAPGISDSRLVNAAAWSYYSDLLRAGVDIYLYRKGFIHVKTMVVDDYISIVGTANMDYRSFDLNFEVNAVIYGEKVAEELREDFNNDLKDADKIRVETWLRRPLYKQLPERIARLLSPLL